MDWFYLAIQIAGIICGLIGGISGVVIWALKSNFVTHAQLTKRFEAHDEVHHEIEVKLNSGQVHFTRVDGDLKHAPTHEDIEGLRRDLAKLQSSVAALDVGTQGRDQRMERIENSVDRLLDFQLQGGGK
jgi:hypothetical protein